MKVSRNKKQVLAEIKCNFTPLKNNLIEKQQPFTPIDLLDPSDLKTPIKNYEIISIEKKYIDHLQEHLSDLFVKLGALNNEKKTFKSIQTQTDISYIQIKISQVQRIHKHKDVNEDIVKCEENKNLLKEKNMNNHIIEPQRKIVKKHLSPMFDNNDDKIVDLEFKKMNEKYKRVLKYLSKRLKRIEDELDQKI